MDRPTDCVLPSRHAGAPDADAPVDATAQALRLFGTGQVPARQHHLVAGDFHCVLEDGALRRLCWKDTELIRGVAYLLRDANWGTAPGTLRHLRIEQFPDHFQVRFELVLALPAGALTARAELDGNAQGRFSFRVSASSPVALRTNRCGFVVLHPASVAGATLAVQHTDGAHEATRFPELISPGQPVFDIRRLSHSPQPGLSVDCCLEAELPHDPLGKFEMEDQRNWSDASFKTYVGSLLDPWPTTLPAGQDLTQAVTIQVDVAPARRSERSPGPTRPPLLTVGPTTGARMPPIGLGVPGDLPAMRAEERQAVLVLRPAWLVAEVELAAPGAGQPANDDALASRLRQLSELARACGAQVQLDVICPARLAPAQAARALSDACVQSAWWPDAVRPCPAPYLKSYQPQGQWPSVPPLHHYAQAFASAFPGQRVGGGMATYFTELNRKRPSSEHLQFIGHNTCPIVHAADDGSVMETLESLPHIVRSVQALWPTLGYRLGPVTLAMQRNPYGDAPAPNPERLRLAMAREDPRHQAAFGAAWLAGYAAAVAASGLELLSFNHSHGRSGPLLSADQPDWQPGACVPAWRVQQVLARASGAALLALSGLPPGVAGLAWTSADGTTHLLVANLTAQPIALRLAQTPYAPSTLPPGTLHLTPFQVLTL